MHCWEYSSIFSATKAPQTSRVPADVLEFSALSNPHLHSQQVGKTGLVNSHSYRHTWKYSEVRLKCWKCILQLRPCRSVERHFWKNWKIQNLLGPCRFHQIILFTFEWLHLGFSGTWGFGVLRNSHNPTTQNPKNPQMKNENEYELTWWLIIDATVLCSRSDESTFVIRKRWESMNVEFKMKLNIVFEERREWFDNY